MNEPSFINRFRTFSLCSLFVVGCLLSVSSAQSQSLDPTCQIWLGAAGGTNPVIADIPAGQTVALTWNFTSCSFGIQGLTFSATQPYSSKAGFKAFSSSQPLSMSLHDPVTGQSVGIEYGSRFTAAYGGLP